MINITIVIKAFTLKTPYMRKLAVLTLVMCSLLFQSATRINKPAETILLPYTGATITNMCTGESVTVSGSMLFVFVNNSKMLAKPQDLTFVSNGETFRAVGMTMLSTKSVNNTDRLKFSGVNNMIFLGETSGTKYMLNESGHYELSPDGTISSFVYNRQLRCP